MSTEKHPLASFGPSLPSAATAPPRMEPAPTAIQPAQGAAFGGAATLPFAFEESPLDGPRAPSVPGAAVFGAPAPPSSPAAAAAPQERATQNATLGPVSPLGPAVFGAGPHGAGPVASAASAAAATVTANPTNVATAEPPSPVRAVFGPSTGDASRADDRPAAPIPPVEADDAPKGQAVFGPSPTPPSAEPSPPLKAALAPPPPATSAARAALRHFGSTPDSNGLGSYTDPESGLSVTAVRALGTFSGAEGCSAADGAIQCLHVYDPARPDAGPKVFLVDGATGNIEPVRDSQERSGGSGDDQHYVPFGASDFAGDTIVRDTGGKDIVHLLAELDPQKLWFERSEDSLVASVLGEERRLVVADHYDGQAIEGLRILDPSGGKSAIGIDTRGIDLLVQAMAGLTPPQGAASWSDLGAGEQQALQALGVWN